jgi:DNA-binding NarL/FixJ family response regulator
VQPALLSHRAPVPLEPNPPLLVIDDDDDFRTFVADLLRGAGHEVDEAATGSDALARVRVERPSLIVLDVHLPDISGYEVCRELRDEFGDLLPIIFISGERTESYDRVSGLLLGADDYLVKPFAADELLARVRRLLTRSAEGEAARRGHDLTPRELEIMELLATGRSQAAIAEQLVLSEKTVATHIQHILPKLGVHSRAEAVAFAHRQGLINLKSA